MQDQLQPLFLISGKRRALLFFLSIGIGVYVYIGVSLHTNLLNFNNLLGWTFCGIITTSFMFIFFYFYTVLYMWILIKLSHLLFYVSALSTFSTSYGIYKLFLYGCLIVSYTFSSNIYKYVYPSVFPMLSGFIPKLVLLGIVVTEIATIIGTYLQLYEFAEKRLSQRQKKKF
jgi:hypothetical protein